MKNNQPTGFKDKTGREILVGDKIEFEDHYEAEFHGMESEIKRGVVKFKFGCFYVDAGDDKFTLYDLPFMDCDHCYVNRKSYLIVNLAKKQKEKKDRRNTYSIVGKGSPYRDGGTLSFQTVFVDAAGKESIYFIFQDYRRGSNTYGEFFDKYSGDKGAKKIAPENIKNPRRY